ncbi:MAG: glycosyltransferase [Armatimonadota bacterium]
MQVTFLTSWDERCGIAEYSRGLVPALRERVGVEVVPATFRRSSRVVYASMGRALNGGDVAHVQHSYAFFGGMHPLRSGWGALAAEVRVPLLLTVHELDVQPTGAYRLPPPLEVAYKRRFNRATFLHPAVSGWMVHSAALRDALLELGAPEGRVRYRPMPVPTAPEAPVDPSPLRRRFGLEGKRVLAILGFLARRKGYDVALEALRQLPPDYVLLAAGGEHVADRSGTEAVLREEAQRLGMGDRFVVSGYLGAEELEHATALAEVILAPFREMSGSASLSYALARRKAVVASDLPENRRLPCVRLFPSGDPAALAEAVRELASPTARAALERAAADYAERNSYAALAAETADFYAELGSK